jgi:DNA-binding transcriptional ArsR family regulator
MNLDFDQFHTEQASALLRAMGNPQRLRILLLLAERERSVIELEALVGLSQSAVSQHLARLRQAKLVRFRRDGQMTFYALDGAEVQSILMTLHLLYGRDKSSVATAPSSRSSRWRLIRPINPLARRRFRGTSA